MKNSFILYYDLKEVFDFLTDEEAGKIIKAVFRYEISGEEEHFDDRMMASTYKRITDNLDRNKVKYKQVCEARREAINQRWHSDNKDNVLS